jgi:hypothetical protein
LQAISFDTKISFELIEEYQYDLLLPIPMLLFKKNQHSIAAIVFFLFLIFGFNLYSEETNQSTILFQNESDLLLVGKHTYFLEDRYGNLSLEDILNLKSKTCSN